MRQARVPSGSATWLIIALVAGWIALTVEPVQANPLLQGSPAQTAAQSQSQPGWLGEIWLKTVALQRDLVRDLAEAMGRIKREGGTTSFWVAVVLCFTYGFLHAAGPGHGKLIVVSYFVGERASWKRGLIMGGQIAATHVVSAILVVVLVDVTFRQIMGGSPAESTWVRILSYGLIAVIGALMVWRALHRWITGETQASCCAHTEHEHNHEYNHGHNHEHNHEHNHGHQHAGHQHNELTRGTTESRRRGTVLALVAGMVPCTGALLIMLYALANNLVWVGVALVVAISLGMATFMGGLGMLAIFGRTWVINRLEEGSSRQVMVVGSLEVLAGLAIAGVGLLFALATYYQVPGVGG